ncbi:glycoside hydrolase family 61 protein [Ephemerocybe angulata]|uniref:lytic cellulose monooxygenase (C4-dehydrogenating) n=1 Tax=Ephemerocybe angulata TaxID=980116 RepID=A0A8H6M222_9AGAR|nr:glycoside hydrolase family 61 protein [Tulosesus angulatus]
MFASKLLVLPLLLASYVHAHGFVHEIAVDGKTYTGAQPSDQRSDLSSIIRQIRDASPVKGANNPDTNCGASAFVASDVGTVQPGDSLTFDWRGADLSRWPHNTGPMLTYLASCGDTACNEFDSTKARWFKIDQQAKKPDGGDWYQADLMQGGKGTASIPSNIAPGNYLMRHEIIALHLGQSMGGAEFYPSCSQLKIGGSGTGTPKDNELVSFPGGYSDDDPGIFVPNVYDNNLDYQFPGPPIAALVTADGPAPTTTSKNGGTSTTKATGTSSSTAKPTSTEGSGGVKSQKCKLKKGSGKTGGVYARHVRRAVRRAFGRKVSA